MKKKRRWGRRGGLKNNFFLELTLSQKQSGLER